MHQQRVITLLLLIHGFLPVNARLLISSGTDQQNRALEAATVTLRYFTALCLPMGKTREIFDLHFLAKPGFFQAKYCDVTKVEVPNCVLTCNMRNEFVAVWVKIQRLQMSSLLTSASCRNKQCARIRGVAFKTH